jgi:hypothetical protein
MSLATNNKLKRMKKNQTILLAVVAFSFFLCQTASALLPFPLYSGMYNFTSGQLGTVGSSEGWANNNTFITVTNGTGSLDGTTLGLVASTGDKVVIAATTNNTAGTGTDNAFAAKGTFPQTTNVDLYYSFLYKFDSVPPNGGFARIIQVNLQNSGSTIYWGLTVTNNAGQIQLGIEKTPGSGNPIVFAASNLVVGQTYFIVARHQILPGSTDDIMDLWINPSPASFGVDETSVPPTSATTSTGTEPNSTTGPGRFYLDVSTNFSAEFDELRIATNWALVTPAYGSCITAGIYQNPVSLTNVAEIADTFTVVPLPGSTSPTYQWQISGPGSSVWTNISGANSSTYATPNLVLATDNGNQYRAIVTTPCDGTSVTSSVATVTLTAPVVTPPGLVLNETFPGILEPITPVTSNNASWFTADSSKLDIYSTPGTMIATPISGGSSLWLGYFTPTNIPPANNLPVHLAVGNTIKVTFPFIPNSYNYFTGNASLRIGLFDYADGGNRVIADDSTVGGSAGNGVNVRGYMLSLDFGPTFTASSPLSLLARTGLSDINLMGTTSDYVSLGSGPAGGGYTNAPAFQAGVEYTLVFSVTRSDQNAVVITNSISGGGTNWTYSVTETNQAYHRFDAFAVRPNSLETSADSFNIPGLRVEVLAGPVTPASITLAGVSRSGNNVTLSWTPTPAGSFSYTVQRKINLTDANWTTLQAGVTTVSYTDTTATGSTGFYRVTSP